MAKEAFAAAACRAQNLKATPSMAFARRRGRPSGVPGGPFRCSRDVPEEFAEDRSPSRPRGDIEAREEALLIEGAANRPLLTILGLGPINPLVILAKPGALRRFPHHRLTRR
jgi:hypothetical protein